ncbi:hypothetical protein [Serpentinicella sp. ANB-PHB4]|uniref:hypothetical protein n=1 Tax=Serpentinicella sp. ANB-PHB4 TaxID=3074076 RepID=UPI002F3F5935
MSSIKETVEKQKLYFEEGRTKDLNFRLEKLKILRQEIINNEKEIMEALKKDLNKAPFESYETEIGLVLEELKYYKASSKLGKTKKS